MGASIPGLMGKINTNRLSEALGIPAVPAETSSSIVPATPHTTTESLSVREKILNLLSYGMAASDVADATGVSPSRISQLLAEPEFKSRLDGLKYERMQGAAAKDDQMDRIEGKILDNLEKTVHLVADPLKLTRMLKEVNGLKRRTTGMGPAHAPDSKTVKLNIGVNLINQFQVNANSEVIAVGGKSLLTMPSGQFRRFADENTKSICEAEPQDSGSDQS